MDSEKNIKNRAYDADRFPGVSTDMADDEKIKKEAVKRDVKELNDNPRNNGKLV